MDRAARIDSLWRRWTAITVVVALLVGVGLVSPIIADATGRDSTVTLRLDVPDAAGEQLTAVAGVGRTPARATNGDDVRLEVRRDASTLVRVLDDAGRVRALAPVVDVTGIDFPTLTVDDHSTAAALAFLRPGVLTSSDVIVDALVYDALLSSDELDGAATAVAAVRADGGDPFLSPDDRLGAAIEELVRDADQILQRRVEAVVDDVLASGPPVATAYTGALLERGELPTACESFDRAEPCGAGADRETCQGRDPELLVDLDGREGDNVCVAVTPVETAEDDEDDPDTVHVSAVNLSPRWVNLYRSDNHGLRPDAVLAPKQWSLPSVEGFIADIGQLLLRYGAEQVWGAALRLFRIGDPEPRTLQDRFSELFRSYAAPETTSLDLDMGETGAVVATVAGGIPRTLSADPLTRGRYLMALGQTAVTEWVIPAIAFALGTQRLQDRGVCKDQEGSSAADLEERLEKAGLQADVMVLANANPSDLCSAVLSLSSAVVPMALRIAANDQDLELADLFSIVGELVQGVYQAAQGTLERQLRDHVGGDDEVARWLDALAAQGYDAGKLAGVVLDNLEAIVTGLLQLDLDAGGDILLGLVDEAVELVVSALVPGAALVSTLNRIVDAANAVAPVIEFLIDAWQHDVQDQYRVQPRPLSELPTRPPPEPFADGTTPTTTLLVLDASGSMGDPAPGGTGQDKQTAATEAGAVLLDVIETDVQLGSDHAVGVVVFSDGVKDQLAPTADFTRVRSFLRGVASGGGTRIDTALGAAFGALETRDGLRSAVLLTDGMVEASQQQAVLANYGSLSRVTGISVSTVAFAFPDSTEDRFLQQLAESTGGRFDAPSSGFELQQVFVRGRHDDTGEIVEDLSGTVDADGREIVVEVPAEVGDQGAPPAELVVTVLGDGEALAVTATDPLGVPIDRSRVRVVDGNPVTVVIPSPIPGTWRLQVAPADASRDSAAGEVVIAAPPGPPVAAAGPTGAVDFSMTASVRPGAPVPPTPRAATPAVRGAAAAAAGLWVLLVLVGAWRLRDRRPDRRGSDA